MVMLLPQGTLTANAAEGDRTIYLYHTHTGETGRFTFKRNGQYDQRVLNDLNRFLADWRTKQQTKMDPALFDLLWTVYQEVGATQPIHIRLVLPGAGDQRDAAQAQQGRRRA